MKKFLSILITILLIAMLIFSFSYIIKYYFDTYKTKKESTSLDHIPIAQDKVEPIKIDTAVEEVKTKRMLQVETLKKENPDIIGWIEIENTDINYPVLQGIDNNYYMNHNDKKEKSINGAIFLDKDYQWDPPSSNLLIYGHNMKNNTMFQHLLKYKNKEFYQQHPVIRFTTTKEDVNFEIISVFESRVYYKSEKNVFRYYYFINAENELQYNEYVENAKKASLYNINTTANYNEQLMTLLTCAYHTKDGRFVVVAKKGTKHSE